MFCTKCGTKIEEGERFCTGCGTPAGEPQALPQTPEQPQQYLQTADMQTSYRESTKKRNKLLLIAAIVAPVIWVVDSIVFYNKNLFDGYGGYILIFLILTISTMLIVIGQRKNSRKMILVAGIIYLFTSYYGIPSAVMCFFVFAEMKRENTKRNVLIAIIAGVIILSFRLPLLFMRSASNNYNRTHLSFLEWNDLPLNDNDLDNLDKAIKQYNIAIRLSPLLPFFRRDSYESLGDIYSKKGLYDEAIRYYTKAIMIKSNNSSYVNRGNAYRNKGDYDQAIADYNEAIRLYPDNIYAYEGRGDTYMLKCDYDRAIADYTDMIRASGPFGNRGYALNARGLAYMANGNIDRAIADFEEVLRVFNTEYHKKLFEEASKNLEDARRARGR